MRAHDACRRDLMTARHRVSKMLLRHGRVYPRPSTWTFDHRRWLSAQQFDEPASELAFADLLAAMDGLTARKAAIAERLSRLAQDEQWWPTVARLRCFRGVDTLTALAFHLELGADWQRFMRPARSARGSGSPRPCSSPASHPVKARSRRPDRRSPGGCWSSPPGITAATHGSARPCKTASRASPITSCRSLTAPSSGCTASTRRMSARGKPHNVTVVAAARELACFLWAAATARLTPATASPVGRPGRRAIQRPARATQLWAAPDHGCHARS